MLSCADRTSQGCGRAAIDYGLFPATLINYYSRLFPATLTSYWDEYLEQWEAIEVLDGKHRRASKAEQVERRVMKGRE